MAIDWNSVRKKVTAAILRVNPAPVVMRRVLVSGTFDTITGVMGADTYQSFSVAAVLTESVYGAAILQPIDDSTREPLGAFFVRQTADIIFAASSSYVPQVGDILEMPGGNKILATVEPFRATLGTALAYGAKFSQM